MAGADEQFVFTGVIPKPENRMEKYGVIAGTEDDSHWHDEMMGESLDALANMSRIRKV